MIWFSYFQNMAFLRFPRVSRKEDRMFLDQLEGPNSSASRESIAELGTVVDAHLAKTRSRRQGRRGQRTKHIGEATLRSSTRGSSDSCLELPKQTSATPDQTDTTSAEAAEFFLEKLVSEIQQYQETLRNHDTKPTGYGSKNVLSKVSTQRVRHKPRRHRSTSLNILRVPKEETKPKCTDEPSCCSLRFSRSKRPIRRHRSYNQVVTKFLNEVRTQPRRHKSDLGRTAADPKKEIPQVQAPRRKLSMCHQASDQSCRHAEPGSCTKVGTN